MNKFMKRLSRSSLGRSSSNLNAMIDIQEPDGQPFYQTSDADSTMSDSDLSLVEDSLPPQIPPPPPPRPPPRRRRKSSPVQSSIFYTNIVSNSEEPIKQNKTTIKRPSIPPPIPPRSISLNESEHKKNNLLNKSQSEDKSRTSTTNHIFPEEEMIESLTQNLSVMEELNYKLRSELKECREENANLMNELAAIHIERNQLLQICKEVDQLKDNEWTCAICMEDRHFIASIDRQIVATFCGHLFCNHCLNDALTQENVCPTCRQDFSKENRPVFQNIYF